MSPTVTCSPAMSLHSFSNLFPITPLVTSAHCSCVNLWSVSLSQGFCTYCFLFLECTSVPYPCGFFSHLFTVSWSSFPHSQWCYLRSLSWKHFVYYTLSSPDCIFLHCLYHRMACVISYCSTPTGMRARGLGLSCSLLRTVLVTELLAYSRHVTAAC